MSLISWGTSIKYDNGMKPSVGMDKRGNVVEVHTTDNPAGNSLWYRVGKRSGKSIDWGESKEYDSGLHPHVALNEDCVVEVHQSQYERTLWYRVGVVNFENKSISWSKSKKYDNGITPAVAINNNGNVVEVHATDNPLSSSLFYRTGTINVDKKEIHFHESHHYDTGKNPSIALNDNQQVIEVHEGDTWSIGYKLWYHTGTFKGKKVSFNDSIHYDKGVNPSITLTNSDVVIEAHKSELNGTLWFHDGKLHGTKLRLGKNHIYDNGTNPSVAATTISTTDYFTSQRMKALFGITVLH